MTAAVWCMYQCISMRQSISVVGVCINVYVWRYVSMYTYGGMHEYQQRSSYSHPMMQYTPHT